MSLSKITFFLIAVIYLAASFVHGPVDPEAVQGVPHIRIGPFVLAPPMVLSGDSPHYLVAVNSLIQDWDFDLKNNYDQAAAGSWDMGARFRNKPIDRHVDVTSDGRQLGTHSPFFTLLLAPFAAPFAGTQWVAWVCIWLTLAAGLTGIWIYGDWLHHRSVEDSALASSLLLLALATPLLCYSRDIWTEPFVLTIWVGMLVSTHLGVLAILGFAGTLLKYPFAVVPAAMGLIALYRGNRDRGLILIGSSLAGLSVTIGTIQWMFRDVDHFSLFHSGRHRGFDLPFDGMVGILFEPETGLLLFFPFLAWSLLKLPRAREGMIYLPAILFFFVHASYQGWHGGTGFSSRYLVPLLPVLTLAVSGLRFRSALFIIAIFYSLFWGLLGGFFPALVYDRSPWGVLLHIWENVGRLAG